MWGKAWEAAAEKTGTSGWIRRVCEGRQRGVVTRHAAGMSGWRECGATIHNAISDYIHPWIRCLAVHASLRLFWSKAGTSMQRKTSKPPLVDVVR